MLNINVGKYQSKLSGKEEVQRHELWSVDPRDWNIQRNREEKVDAVVRWPETWAESETNWLKFRPRDCSLFTDHNHDRGETRLCSDCQSKSVSYKVWTEKHQTDVMIQATFGGGLKCDWRKCIRVESRITSLRSYWHLQRYHMMFRHTIRSDHYINSNSADLNLIWLQSEQSQRCLDYSSLSLVGGNEFPKRSDATKNVFCCWMYSSGWSVCSSRKKLN